MKNTLSALVPSFVGFFIAYLLIVWFLRGDWFIAQAFIAAAIFTAIVYLYHRFIR